MISTQQYYQKLADNVPLTEDEVVSMIREIQNLRDGVAHLASCQAATLEGLTKSTSKSERSRHLEICKSAAKILQGDVTAIRYKTTSEHALKHCLEAIAESQPDPVAVANKSSMKP